MDLTKALTDRFQERNYAWQPGLDCNVSSLYLAPDWRGARQQAYSRRRPTFPRYKCPPQSGDDCEGRVDVSVASAALCLHRSFVVSQPSLTTKCMLCQ